MQPRIGKLVGIGYFPALLDTNGDQLVTEAGEKLLHPHITLVVIWVVSTVEGVHCPNTRHGDAAQG